MRQCLLVSLIIHAIILSIKIPKSKFQNKSTVKIKLEQQKDKKNKGVEKDEDLYIVQNIIDVLEKVEELAKEEAAIKSMLNVCESYYMGIGIVHSSFLGKIVEVVPGGPADKAGIKVGDIPLDSLEIRDKYEEGTQITIPILRDGIMYQIPVTIGKICTKEKDNENKEP